MKITDVKPIHLRIPPLDKPGYWGYDAFLVEIHTDEGIIGIGESDTNPEVAKACVLTHHSHWHSIGLRELLIGENPLEIERLWDKMYFASNYYGRRGAGIHAISAIDIALWDIASQYYNVPIHTLLGGKFRDKIKVYGTMEDDDTSAEVTLERIKERVAKGWKCLKMGSFEATEAEVERLYEIREVLGDDVEFCVDALTNWRTYANAVKMFKALEPLNLKWIEEPVMPDDMDGYRKLNGMTSAMVAGGEALTTRYEFKNFIENGHPDIIQPDITRVGGISEMRKIHDIASLHGVQMIPHDYSTPILISASVQFLAATNDGDMFEYCTSTSPLLQQLCTNKIEFDDGYVNVPDCIGLGLEFDREFMKKYEVHL